MFHTAKLAIVCLLLVFLAFFISWAIQTRHFIPGSTQVDQAELTTNTAYFDSIVLNLFTNAIKYKSPERDLDIDISFYKKDNYDVLLFKDNGVGIDLDTHGEMIFGMYKTFHGNLDAKGLGLFIIKTQIEAMGGKIEVESKLNQFTSFKVYFKQD